MKLVHILYQSMWKLRKKGVHITIVSIPTSIFWNIEMIDKLAYKLNDRWAVQQWLMRLYGSSFFFAVGSQIETTIIPCLNIFFLPEKEVAIKITATKSSGWLFSHDTHERISMHQLSRRTRLIHCLFFFVYFFFLHTILVKRKISLPR